MLSHRTQVFSERQKQKKRSTRIRRTWIYSLLVLSLALGVVSVLRNDRFLLTSYQVSGNDTLSKDEVLRVSEEKLSGNYLLLIPRRNAYLFPAKEMTATLLQSFPKLQSVEVKRSNEKTLSISLTERKPVLVACAAGEATSSKCFFADEEGFLFSDAPEFSRPLFLSYEAPPGTALGIQDTLLPQDEFRILQFFSNEMKKQGYPFARVILSTGLRTEGVFAGGGRIIFERDRKGLEEAWQNFKTLLSSGALDAYEVSEGFKLQYIDLLSGNKIFYKP